jgi:hypothetical protein
MTNPFLGHAPSTCLVGLRRSLARRVKDKNPSYHYTYPHTSDESQGVTLTVPADHKLRRTATRTRSVSPQKRQLQRQGSVLPKPARSTKGALFLPRASPLGPSSTSLGHEAMRGQIGSPSSCRAPFTHAYDPLWRSSQW